MPAIEKVVSNLGLSDINPLICGKEECESAHSYGPATRGYWLLHFVVSGKGRFECPRGAYELGKNEIFIIRPYEITYYKADEKDPWCYIWIGFTADTLLPPALTARDTLYAPFLSEIFINCVSMPDLSGGGKGYEAMLCAKIWEIIALLSEQESPAGVSAERYVRSAVTLMEAEFCNGITVSDVAKRLHLNRSYFSVIFRETVKKSPGRYLAELRMEKAANLLTEHSCSVTVTALSVGFQDVFTFSRTFKKYFGVSPTAYAALTP